MPDIETVIRHLHRTVHQGAATDGQLLTAFIDHTNEMAFAALVNRHGPMVWGVCRRVLNHHDAEDAFQAAFLILARKARSVKPREMVGSWLHGVAYRTALQARAGTLKQHQREKQVPTMPEPEAAAQENCSDLYALLDQELTGLPETYRHAIILCDLAEKSIKEAARQLGWPQGTLASRLFRGRKLLAKRLANRGVVFSAGLLAADSANAVSAGVPTSLMSSTVKAAEMIAAGQVASAGVISVKVAALMEGVLKNMLVSKLKASIAIVLALGFMATGATVLSCLTAAAQSEKSRAGSGITFITGAQTNQEPKTDKELLEGVWRVVSLTVDGKELTKEEMEGAAVKIVFAGDTAAVYNASGVKTKGTYSLDSAKKPKSMDLIPPEGKTVRMIYKLEGDTLTIAEGGDDSRPEDFTGRGAAVAVVKRVIAAEAKQDAPRTDLDRLQGIWSVVSVEEGGKPAKLEKAVFMVDGKRACWQTTEFEMQGGLYLDPTSKPNTYDFVMSERTIEGIYSLDDDALRLCYDIGTAAKRPTGFGTAKSGRQILFLLKRIHGPEVFPYRLADGTRAFPPVIERPKKAMPPPRVAPTPKDSNSASYNLPAAGADEPPASKDFRVKAGEGKRITVESEEQTKLHGSWTPVSWDLFGEKMPNESMDIMKVIFAGDQLVFNRRDNPTETFTYKIAADRKPHRLNLVWSDGPLKGNTTTMVYQIDGATLRLMNGETQQMPSTLTLRRAVDSNAPKKHTPLPPGTLR
jgi:RNA polymerase sigma factor (sigma-70 family)